MGGLYMERQKSRKREMDEQELSNFVNDLLISRESDEVEFKSATGGFPGSFWDTYSAFANTHGGTIILGISEKKDMYYSDNLSDETIEKYKKEFWSALNNKTTTNLNLLKNDDVVATELNGSKLLIFYIPQAKREQRPVYRGLDPYQGSFKRNFEGDYKCTESEVKRMFSDSNISVSADKRILYNYSMDDIDLESLHQYRRLMEIAHPGHVWLEETDEKFLEKIGAYRKDRRAKEEGFTLAGILMFGKTDSINDDECAPNYFPDYRDEELSLSATRRWIDRVCPDGTWEANLFQFYRRVLPKLQSFLPKPFRMENNIRIDESPAHISIREAFINLCVHADYSAEGSLLVVKRGDSFIFSNPGTLLVSLQQYYEGGESVCRNPNLQKMFMLLGTAEKAGSGVDKIIKGWSENNWRRPLIREKIRPDKVEVRLQMLSLLDDSVCKELDRIYGSQVKHIDKNMLMTLSLALTEEEVSNERLRFSLNIHKADISQMLQKMCKLGLLESKGSGRGTTYHIPSAKVAISSPNKATSNANMATYVGSNKATSDANRATSGSNRATSGSNRITLELPKRMTKEQMSVIVVDFCDDWKTKEDISRHINRTVKYIKDVVLPFLLKGHLIKMKYPDIPNHPKQKYCRVSFDEQKDIKA